MVRLPAAYCSVLIVCMGCGNGDAQPDTEGTRASTEKTDDASTDKNDVPIVDRDTRELDSANGDPVSMEELKAAIARHKDTSTWHYGERPDGYPTGTWLSEDEDQEPLVFEKDGTFKCGFVWRKGAGSYASGRYAISENGLIVAVAKHNGVRIGPFYHLKAGTLIGSRGPNPRVEWKKISAAKEKE